MLVAFKQEVIEQYSSFKTQGGFAGRFGSRAFVNSLCKQLAKALELKHPANPSPVLKPLYCSHNALFERMGKATGQV